LVPETETEPVPVRVKEKLVEGVGGRLKEDETVEVTEADRVPEKVFVLVGGI
jgi:hypothetical protein